MNDARRRERAADSRVTSDVRVPCNERDDDELQSDQGAGGRTDDHVEVFPSGGYGHDRLASFARGNRRYFSSLTCSIQWTTLPSSSSWMAMCVISLSGMAPCQCFSPGGLETTSPGCISLTVPSPGCTGPPPA